MKERKGEEHQKSIKNLQTQSRHMVLREKGFETGKKTRKIKASLPLRASPKPWVAGSNPPAPAKKSVHASVRIFYFFTFHYSLFTNSVCTDFLEGKR